MYGKILIMNLLILPTLFAVVLGLNAGIPATDALVSNRKALNRMLYLCRVSTDDTPAAQVVKFVILP